jgi:hypothetical protein
MLPAALPVTPRRVPLRRKEQQVSPAEWAPWALNLDRMVTGGMSVCRSTTELEELLRLSA